MIGKSKMEPRNTRNTRTRRPDELANDAGFSCSRVSELVNDRQNPGHPNHSIELGLDFGETIHKNSLPTRYVGAQQSLSAVSVAFMRTGFFQMEPSGIYSLNFGWQRARFFPLLAGLSVEIETQAVK